MKDKLLFAEREREQLAYAEHIRTLEQEKRLRHLQQGQPLDHHDVKMGGERSLPLDHYRRDMRGGDIRGDPRDMRGEMRGDIRGDLRGEMRGDIRGDLRGEMRGLADHRDMRGEMRSGDIRTDIRGDARGGSGEVHKPFQSSAFMDTLRRQHDSQLVAASGATHDRPFHDPTSSLRFTHAERERMERDRAAAERLERDRVHQERERAERAMQQHAERERERERFTDRGRHERASIFGNYKPPETIDLSED